MDIPLPWPLDGYPVVLLGLLLIGITVAAVLTRVRAAEDPAASRRRDVARVRAALREAARAPRTLAPVDSLDSHDSLGSPSYPQSTGPAPSR